MLPLKQEGNFKSGYAAIVGKPNVGKSTLLNHLVMRKIAATSSKPQTTRNKITGVVHFPGGQVILLDTPGIHKTNSQFNQLMVKASLSTYHDVDLILFVVDAKQGFAENDIFVLDTLKGVESPKILIINKIDLVSKPDLLGLIAEADKKFNFREIIPVSALLSDGLEGLGKTILNYLPEGPRYFPEDMITDCSEGFLIEEIIREKILLNYKKEVPYATEVEVEEFKEDEDIIHIRAIIYVERDTQKGIIIGHKGEALKKTGTMARKDIEAFFEKKVFLGLFVKVDKDWKNKQRSLKKFGYQ